MHATRVGSHAHRPLESGPRAIPLTQRAGSHPGHGRGDSRQVRHRIPWHGAFVRDIRRECEFASGNVRDTTTTCSVRQSCDLLVSELVCAVGRRSPPREPFSKTPWRHVGEPAAGPPSGSICDVVCGGMPHHRCGCHGLRGPARQASASSGHQGASSGHQVGVSGHQVGVQDSGCGRFFADIKP